MSPTIHNLQVLIIPGFWPLVQLPLSWSTDCYYWHLVGNTETLLLDTPKKRRKKKSPTRSSVSALWTSTSSPWGGGECLGAISQCVQDKNWHHNPLHVCLCWHNSEDCCPGTVDKMFYWAMIDHGQSCDGQLKEEILLLWWTASAVLGHIHVPGLCSQLAEVSLVRSSPRQQTAMLHCPATQPHSQQRGTCPFCLGPAAQAAATQPELNQTAWEETWCEPCPHAGPGSRFLPVARLQNDVVCTWGEGASRDDELRGPGSTQLVALNVRQRTPLGRKAQEGKIQLERVRWRSHAL